MLQLCLREGLWVMTPLVGIVRMIDSCRSPAGVERPTVGYWHPRSRLDLFRLTGCQSKLHQIPIFPEFIRWFLLNNTQPHAALWSSSMLTRLAVSSHLSLAVVPERPINHGGWQVGPRWKLPVTPSVHGQPKSNHFTLPSPPPPRLSLCISSFPPLFRLGVFVFSAPPIPTSAPPPTLFEEKKWEGDRSLGGRKEGMHWVWLTPSEHLFGWVGGWGACVSSLCQRNKSLKKLQKLRLGLFFFLPPELRNDPTVCLLSEGSDPIRTPPKRPPTRKCTL